MANTTFNGPVRSENGFKGISKNASTGAITENFEINSSGAYVGTLLQGQGIVTSAAKLGGAGSTEVTFSQPNNTIITSIQIVITTAITTGSGDVGFQVGTATGGAQLVTAAADDIIDGGTTAPAGSHYTCTLNDTTASAASPAASPRVNVTGAARNIFLQITNTATVSAVGALTFVIAYKQFA